MSGPEATAGSIWIFLKPIGTTVPTRLEINMAKDQGKADAGRYAKGRKGIVGFYRIDIKTNAQDGNASQDQSIEETGALPFG